MTDRELKSISVGELALECVVVGLLCSIAVACFPQVRFVQAGAFSLGFMSACLGGGLALWFSIRLRERLCFFALLLSVPNVVVWAWLFQHLIYESPAYRFQ